MTLDPIQVATRDQRRRFVDQRIPRQESAKVTLPEIEKRKLTGNKLAAISNKSSARDHTRGRHLGRHGAFLATVWIYHSRGRFYNCAWVCARFSEFSRAKNMSPDETMPGHGTCKNKIRLKISSVCCVRYLLNRVKLSLLCIFERTRSKSTRYTNETSSRKDDSRLGFADDKANPTWFTIGK